MMIIYIFLEKILQNNDCVTTRQLLLLRLKFKNDFFVKNSYTFTTAQ